MIVAVADTHALIWALLGDNRLSPAARAVMTVSASDQIGISAISLVEIAYLEEKGRVPIGMLARTVAILAATTSVLAEIPINVSVMQTMTRIPRDAIADMPDRIIAATALHLQVPLISRDATIQASSVETIW
jgi:PIN domain nuclease of toxin-antitoxin system